MKPWTSLGLLNYGSVEIRFFRGIWKSVHVTRSKRIILAVDKWLAKPGTYLNLALRASELSVQATANVLTRSRRE